MKRIFTFIASIVMVLSGMAQSSGILLSYNKGEQLKFYVRNDLQKAIEDALIGDTLYFSAGSFSFSFLPQIDDNYYRREWTKPLVMIGAGAQDSNGTTFSIPGTLYLNFDQNVPIEKRNLSFEGIYLSSSKVCQMSDVNELTFKNFRGNTISDNDDLTKQPDDADASWKFPAIQKLTMDNSQINDFSFAYGWCYKIGIYNSKFNSFNGRCNPNEGQTAAIIDHCRIDRLFGWTTGIVKNSLIMSDQSGENGTVQINNCGWFGSNNSANSPKTGCVELSSSFNWDGDNIPTVTGGGSLTLSDGSSMGTTSDYSLYPSYPTLYYNSEDTENTSNIDYDTINKKITIKVKVLGNNNTSSSN